MGRLLGVALAGVLMPRVGVAEVNDNDGPHKSMLAVRATHAPAIDGRLDDPAWETAPPDDRFTQVQPDEGKPPTERTEVRVLYDDRNLYVGVSCFDSDAAGIVSKLTRRDRDIEADWLAVYIDSRHDHQSGHVFQLSSAGVQVDGELYGDTNYSAEWDGVWLGEVSSDPRGWYAEFAIPLTVLRFSSAPEQVWGLQVHRNVSRKREQMKWAYTPSRIQGEVSRFGQLTGIRGIKPRRTLELRPYGVARVRGRTPGGGVLGLQLGGEVNASTDIGVDGKLGLTSSLTLDATVNPDFGQVEADQVVLNLTHFETFFPEKRPFFLEGREVFETPLTLFYPRRIGQTPVALDPGDPLVVGGHELRVHDAPAVVPIWAAAKVSGEVGGGVGIGVMGAITGAENAQAGEDSQMRAVQLAPARAYGVARARLALGSNAHVGATATLLNRLGGELYLAGANHDAYTQALDGRWRAPSGMWRLEGQLVMSERVGGTSHQTPDGRPCPDPAADPTCVPIARADGTPLGPGDVGAGGHTHLSYSSEHWFVEANYNALSPKLDLNDVGFLPDFNTHQLELVAGHVQRHPWSIFQRTSIMPIVQASMAFDGTPQKAVAGADTEWTLKNHVFTSPQLMVGLPGTYDDFETFDGAHFEKPANLDFNWVVQSNSSKALYASIRALARKDLGADGYFLGMQSTLSWQARSNIELSVEPEVGSDQNAIRFYRCATDSGAACLVESGTRHYLFADLDSRFISLIFRATYTFIPTLSVQGYAQLFLADGTFSHYREVDTVGRRPTIDREDLRPSSSGVADGFEQTTFNLQVVLRWEPLPGTTLFGVFTRAQEAPKLGVGQLGTMPSEDVFLLKLVYFMS